MAKFLLIVTISMMAMCQVQCLQQMRNIRFPGLEHHTQRLRFPAHQEAPLTPYPAAGPKPEPPFELPTEEAANFPEPTYGPPDQSYGPPEETYDPPEQTYGPPEETFGPPDQTYGPPDQTYGPPEQTYGPPAENSEPPAETYAPPEQNSPPPAQIIRPAAIETIDPREFYPKTMLTLPHYQRLIDFHSSPKLQKQVSMRGVRRPVQTSAKLIRPDFIETPRTRLTPPLVERLTVFRSGGPRRQPSIAATLRRPQIRRRPSKIQASLKHRPKSTQQVFPIHFADGTTIFSDQLQGWSI